MGLERNRNLRDTTSSISGSQKWNAMDTPEMLCMLIAKLPGALIDRWNRNVQAIRKRHLREPDLQDLINIVEEENVAHDTLLSNSKPVSTSLKNINEASDGALSILDKRREENPDKLIFGNLNINSVYPKFDQMKFSLQGKVDILILTETKLDESFPTTQFLIEGYSKPLRLDRNRNVEGYLFILEKINLVKN